MVFLQILWHLSCDAFRQICLVIRSYWFSSPIDSYSIVSFGFITALGQQVVRNASSNSGVRTFPLTNLLSGGHSLTASPYLLTSEILCKDHLSRAAPNLSNQTSVLLSMVPDRSPQKVLHPKRARRRHHPNQQPPMTLQPPMMTK